MRARAAGVPCIAVGGGVTQDGIEALGAIGVTVVPVSEGPQTVERRWPPEPRRWSAAGSGSRGWCRWAGSRRLRVRID